jgi:hypothetical protein
VKYSLLLVFLLIIGCSKENPTEPSRPIPTVSGKWTGGTIELSATFDMSEINGMIDGSGNFYSDWYNLPAQPLYCAVSGRHGDSEVTLHFVAITSGITAADFVGNLSNGSLITGKLTGFGRVDSTFFFVRQTTKPN